MPLHRVLYFGISAMKYFYFSFSAKDKNRALHEHKTGGGPQPPPLNEIDKAILRILGDSPAFKGVSDATSDSKIELTRTYRMIDHMAQRCQTEIVAETPSLTKAMNTGQEPSEISNKEVNNNIVNFQHCLTF